MSRNYWFEAGDSLVHAFLSQPDSALRLIRPAVVGRAILNATNGSASLDIVDVGGGHARQALWFARQGHSVVIIDPDERMLKSAEKSISMEPEEVRSRIELILAAGEDSFAVLNRKFDILLCHSVISYLSNPVPLLKNFPKLLRENGFVSVLSPNPKSQAMRSGLQRKWVDAIKYIVDQGHRSDEYAPDCGWSLDDISNFLFSEGLHLAEVQGVGVFSDHLVGNISAEEASALCELEWLAGKTDPYRQVARCFHGIFKR